MDERHVVLSTVALTLGAVLLSVAFAYRKGHGRRRDRDG
ncbi:hypothetical protein HNR67_007928 [Crossiella cryophila]|uniref:Uncharacterized protein n=1 Tax=Crossiella cryophila TaxID=43355 RepID=A0A7W7CIL8_9PSEU|nr:hypothetical protein [Crossiella cryophila]